MTTCARHAFRKTTASKTAPDASTLSTESVGTDFAPNSSDADNLQSVYSYFCEQEGDDKVIFQRTQHLMDSDSLFYTTVETAGRQFCGLLDSGSMACTINMETERILLECSGSGISSSRDTDAIVMGCGG